MNPEDIPTLYQVAIAQESNSQHLESLHDLFTKQQSQIDYLMQTLNIQGEVIDLLNKELKIVQGMAREKQPLQ